MSTRETYLLINLGVRVALPSTVANNHQEFMKIFFCDWLESKVRQNGNRCLLDDIIYLQNFWRAFYGIIYIIIVIKLQLTRLALSSNLN